MNKKTLKPNRLFNHLLFGFLLFTFYFLLFGKPTIALADCTYEETPDIYKITGDVGWTCAIDDLFFPTKEVIIDNNTTVAKIRVAKISSSSLVIVAKKLTLRDNAKIDMSAKNSFDPLTALGYTHASFASPWAVSTTYDYNHYYYYAGMPGGCHASMGGRYNINAWWDNGIGDHGIEEQAHGGFPTMPLDPSNGVYAETPPHCTTYDDQADILPNSAGEPGGKLFSPVCVGTVCTDSQGGAGGGIIKLKVFDQIFLGSGAQIIANGGQGQDSGGGGAGGSIAISTQQLDNYGTISADGGRGGNARLIDDFANHPDHTWNYRWIYAGAGGGAGRVFSNIAQINNQGVIQNQPGNTGISWKGVDMLGIYDCPYLKYWTVHLGQPSEHRDSDCGSHTAAHPPSTPPPDVPAEKGQITVKFKYDSNGDGEVNDSDAAGPTDLNVFVRNVRVNYFGTMLDYIERTHLKANEDIGANFYNLQTGSTGPDGQAINNRLYLSIANDDQEGLGLYPGFTNAEPTSLRYGLSKVKIEYLDANDQKVGEQEESVEKLNGYPLLALGKFIVSEKGVTNDYYGFGNSALDHLVLPDGDGTKVVVTVLVKPTATINVKMSALLKNTYGFDSAAQWSNPGNLDPVNVKIKLDRNDQTPANTVNLAGKISSGEEIIDLGPQDLDSDKTYTFSNYAWGGKTNSDGYKLSAYYSLTTETIDKKDFGLAALQLQPIENATGSPGTPLQRDNNYVRYKVGKANRVCKDGLDNKVDPDISNCYPAHQIDATGTEFDDNLPVYTDSNHAGFKMNSIELKALAWSTAQITVNLEPLLKNVFGFDDHNGVPHWDSPEPIEHVNVNLNLERNDDHIYESTSNLAGNHLQSETVNLSDQDLTSVKTHTFSNFAWGGRNARDVDVNDGYKLIVKYTMNGEATSLRYGLSALQLWPVFPVSNDNQDFVRYKVGFATSECHDSGDKTNPDLSSCYPANAVDAYSDLNSRLFANNLPVYADASHNGFKMSEIQLKAIALRTATIKIDLEPLFKNVFGFSETTPRWNSSEAIEKVEYSLKMARNSTSRIWGSELAGNTLFITSSGVDLNTDHPTITFDNVAWGGKGDDGYNLYAKYTAGGDQYGLSALQLLPIENTGGSGTLLQDDNNYVRYKVGIANSICSDNETDKINPGISNCYPARTVNAYDSPDAVNAHDSRDSAKFANNLPVYADAAHSGFKMNRIELKAIALRTATITVNLKQLLKNVFGFNETTPRWTSAESIENTNVKLKLGRNDQTASRTDNLVGKLTEEIDLGSQDLNSDKTYTFSNFAWGGENADSVNDGYALHAKYTAGGDKYGLSALQLRPIENTGSSGTLLQDDNNYVRYKVGIANSICSDNETDKINPGISNCYPARTVNAYDSQDNNTNDSRDSSKFNNNLPIYADSNHQGGFKINSIDLKAIALRTAKVPIKMQTLLRNIFGFYDNGRIPRWGNTTGSPDPPIDHLRATITLVRNNLNAQETTNFAGQQTQTLTVASADLNSSDHNEVFDNFAWGGNSDNQGYKILVSYGFVGTAQTDLRYGLTALRLQPEENPRADSQTPFGTIDDANNSSLSANNTYARYKVGVATSLCTDGLANKINPDISNCYPAANINATDSNFDNNLPLYADTLHNNLLINQVKLLSIANRTGQLRLRFREDPDTSDNSGQGRYCFSSELPQTPPANADWRPGTACDPLPPDRAENGLVNVSLRFDNNTTNGSNLAGGLAGSGIIREGSASQDFTLDNLAWGGLETGTGIKITSTFKTQYTNTVPDSEQYQYNIAGWQTIQNSPAQNHSSSIVFPGLSRLSDPPYLKLGETAIDTRLASRFIPLYFNLSNAFTREPAGLSASARQSLSPNITADAQPSTDLVVFLRKVFKKTSKAGSDSYIYSGQNLPQLRQIAAWTMLSSGGSVENPESINPPTGQIYSLPNYTLGGDANLNLNLAIALGSLDKNFSRLKKQVSAKFTLSDNLLMNSFPLNPLYNPYTDTLDSSKTDLKLPEGRVWYYNGDNGATNGNRDLVLGNPNAPYNSFQYQGKGTIIVENANVIINNYLTPNDPSSSLGIIDLAGTVTINNTTHQPDLSPSSSQLVAANIIANKIVFSYDPVDATLNFRGMALAKQIELARSHLLVSYGSLMRNAPPGFSLLLNPFSQEK